MKTMRVILIFLHIAIIMFAMIKSHPYLNAIAKATDYRKQISTSVSFVINSTYILLHHTASILAILFTDYNYGLIRATGILLIGELLQMIDSIIEHTVKPGHIGAGELFYLIVFASLLLIAIIFTFRLSEKLYQEYYDLKQTKSLNESFNGITIDTEKKSTTA